MARGPKKPRWFGKNKRRGPGHNSQNKDNRKVKKKKLNLGKERDFLFCLDEVLEECDGEELGSHRANILLKFTREGQVDAQEYLDRIDEEIISSEEKEKIARLLNRYSVYR